MNNTLLQSFSFWKALDDQMMSKSFDGKRRTSLYPSEASVIATDPSTGKGSVFGGCHRKVWYRLMGIPRSEPPGVKSQYIFAFGNYIESMLRDISKTARIYNNNSVKFWDGPSAVSGEIDLVVSPYEDPEKYIFVEVKSTHGYYKEKELTKEGPDGTGKPQEAHLLQLGTYLWTHREDPNLIGGKLVYILRDNMTRKEFNVVIEQEANGKHRFLVDGKAELRFYVEDMYARYRVILDKVQESMKLRGEGVEMEEWDAPARDYNLYYDDAAIEELYSLGEIAKTNYEKFKQNKKNRMGSWVCGYCDYKSLCWTKEAITAATGDPALDIPRPARRVSA